MRLVAQLVGPTRQVRAPTPSVASSDAGTPTPEREPATVAPEDGAPIGTEHPAVLVAASPDARWVVLCQARADTDGNGEVSVGLGYHGDLFGDALSPYFVAGSGAGVQLEDFVSSDDLGRYVAVLREGRMHLLDTVSGSDTVLVEADTGDDPNPFGPHRAATFDRTGTRMAYVRTRGGRPVVVVRSLPGGAETEIDPGPGLLYRTQLDPTGHWVTLQVVASDTDHNGRLELPRSRTTLGGRRCRGPVSVYGVYGRSGDQPETRVAPVSGGTARAVPELLLPLGDGLLLRAPDGALRLERPGQNMSELSPASCHGQLFYSDYARQQVLVGCGAGAGDAGAGDAGSALSLALHGLGGQRSLGLTVEREEDQFGWGAGRLRAVRTGGDGVALVDLERGTASALPANARAVHVYEGRALIAQGERWAVLDVGSGREYPLGFTGESYVSATEGPMALVGERVIDLARAAVLGTVEGGLTVSEQGRVLTQGRGSGRLPMGPFAWRRPTPAGSGP